MIQLNFSPRVSNFIDVADVSGNIKNNSLNLQYLNQIDNACIKAGITSGAVYPFIGGVADSHKFNFLDPRDLDIAYRILWIGTLTHTSNGVLSDGTTGRGDIFMTPNDFTISTGVFIGGYINSIGSSRQKSLLGAYDNAGNFNSLQYRPTYNNNANQFISFGNYGMSVSSISTKGMYIANKVPNTNIKVLQKNGSDLSRFTGSNSNVSNTVPINILCTNLHLPNPPSFFTNDRISFININNGVSEIASKIFSHDIYILHNVQ